MFRKLLSTAAATVSLFVLTCGAQAQTFYSPSQAELSSFVFADYWPGNGAALTNTTLVNPDGVQYTFDTGFAANPDAFTRSQFTMPFTQDLTGYKNVGLAFQVPAGGSVNGNSLFAQVALQYAGGSAVSGWIGINPTSRTNVYLPLSVIPPASLAQLTSFDIELRSEDPISPDMGDRVNVFTAPAPPEYVDGFLINNFEGTDAGTWGAAFQPDHVNTIVAADGSEFNNGVTKGTHALQIARTYTGDAFPAGGDNTSFRWGSQMALNAGIQGDYNNNNTVDAADYTRWRNNLNSTTANLPNDPTPTIVNQADYTTWKNNFGQSGNPTILANINAMVDALNTAADTGGRLAFDVSMNNPDPFPETPPLPGFLGYEMFITDGSGGFFQPDTTLIGQVAGQGFGFPPVPTLDSFYKAVTLSLPLNIFRDVSPNAFGLLGVRNLLKTNNFTIGLASNTNGNATFSIDNIRILNLVAPPAGGASAVPEPASAMMLLIAVLGAVTGAARRRR